MNKEMTIAERVDLADAAGRRSPDESIWSDAEAACRQIAPLWPLRDFVAVNPMLGLTGMPFEEAAAHLAQHAGARLLRDEADYADALRRGEFAEGHIAKAIGNLCDEPVATPAHVVRSLKSSLDGPAEPRVEMIKTFADLASEATGENWSAFAVDQISFWAGGYFDKGQSAWKNPWRGEAPFKAWRAQATIDRTPEIMGLAGFRTTIAELPEDPTAALAQIADALIVPSDARVPYFHRLLCTISGWAGFQRYEGWIDELRGEGPRGVVDLLAIRAAYDFALARRFKSSDLDAAWRAQTGARPAAPRGSPSPALVAQTAMEIAYQEKTLSSIAANPFAAGEERPEAQAVFCIDVRSERIRRALEAANPKIDTFGFAGFFGFPIAIVGEGGAGIKAQCPVLLEPTHSVCATFQDDPAASAGRLRAGLRSFAGAWKRFKTGAISSFAFVESLGGAFAGALVRDAANRPARETQSLGALDVDRRRCGGHETGMTLDDKVETARGALAGISFNGRFARIVALVGHGSSTTNNPYAAGLDCGACGGHSGEANARVAAAVLNDPEVRARLAETDWPVPDDTVFIAALHDTTTDDIHLLDEDAAPASHAQDLACLKRDFIDAARAARRDRARTLGLANGPQVDRLIERRSRDWSEVRPEWGLAGCAAFIAAPRERTRGLDLEGRTFLHSYDWRADADNSILELIMTAPLVVASWISLQYFASSTDNRAFGSGDKTLHNVVGGFGVLEGAGGDLRVGLPMQSVHDGRTLFHQPLRLTALIEAPTERIDAVLSKHENVRVLFEHDWLHLIAIAQDGFARYGRGGRWSEERLPAISVNGAPS